MEAAKKTIREHINMFERIESHYTRKDSSRSYLDESLSISHMFRLYNAWMTEEREGTPKASSRLYRDVFNTEFNLSFFKPKKDQCNVCFTYKEADITVKSSMQAGYETHFKNKTRAREEKNLDKEDAKKEEFVCFACFDSQKVLSSPKSEIGLLYYKRKLSVYNFTVFDGGNKRGFCYVWHEATAGRGSNEIASCLLDFIHTQHTKYGKSDFRFYSDNAGSQNKNRHLFSMFVYAAIKYKIHIKHTFLEKGHTQNEADSVHALIESASSKKDVYVPSEWFELIRNAKVNGEKYVVNEVKQNDVFDFHDIVEGQNWAKSTCGKVVRLSKVKQVSTSFEKPGEIQVKYEFDDEPETVQVIPVDGNQAGEEKNKSEAPQAKKRGRPKKKINPSHTVEEESILRLESIKLKQAYSGLLPISTAKYQDLKSLCKDGTIPRRYHAFCESLPFEKP